MLTQLHPYLAACHGRPFRPGSFDGAQLVVGWLETIGKAEPVAGLKGSYSTFKGGLKQLDCAGFKGLEAFADAAFERRPSWMHARPGDIAVMGLGRRACAGIVGRSVIYVVSPAGGLDFVPISEATGIYQP